MSERQQNKDHENPEDWDDVDNVDQPQADEKPDQPTDDTARTIEEAKPFSDEAKAFGRDVAGAIRSIERDDLPNGDKNAE